MKKSAFTVLSELWYNILIRHCIADSVHSIHNIEKDLVFRYLRLEMHKKDIKIWSNTQKIID